MEFTGLEAQVFIGVAVILGCAFVALLCDYLKGVNERLRERTLELTVRVEESDRWGNIVQGYAEQNQAERNQAEQIQALLRQAAPQPKSEAAGAEQVASGPALMQEISRLHREMEQMARSVASLTELRSATGVATQAGMESAAVEELAERELAFAYQAQAHHTQESDAPAAVAQVEAPAMNDGAVLPPMQPPMAASLPTAALPAAADRGLSVVKPATPIAGSVASMVAGLKLPRRDVAGARDLDVTSLRHSTPREDAAVVADQVAPAAQAYAVESHGEPFRAGVVKIRVVRNEYPAEPLNVEAPAEVPVPAPVVAAPEAPVLEAPVVAAPVFEAPVVAAEVPAAELVPQAVPAQISEALTAVPLDEITLDFPLTGSSELALPSGMYDSATLDVLRNDPAPFTGLVVAIGINDFEQLQANAGAEAAQDLVRSVGQLVKSLTSNLAGPQYFACKASEDEFIVAFSGEIGPTAQRRMSSVSERLWDFQLRSIGTFSVVFSWGATEANEESFAEAIEAAGERMRETRRNRKSMGGEKGRKRVVA